MSSDESTNDHAPLGGSLPPPPPPSGRVEIALTASDVFCYSMSHRPLVRSARITNRSVTSGDELVVTFTVEAPGSEELLHQERVALPLPEAGDSLELRTIRLAANPRALALLDEAVSANVVATASVDGSIVSVERQPVNILAYHQWMHRLDTYESFAAFVLPNHPAVARIMTTARDLLEQRTGSSSTEGYQSLGSEPDRVLQITEAIYDALQAQGYRYSNPPASFEGFGQKIRTPDVIADERACTCLDSTVLFASCLSAAGLDPTLFILRGHAFVGVLTGMLDRSADREWIGELLGQVVVSDPNGMAELVSSGAVTPVETTAITDDLSFSAAVAAAETYFRAGTSELRGMVNVPRARAAGVPPLPSRHRSDGVVQVILPSEELRRSDPLLEARSDSTSTASDDDLAHADAFQAPGRVKSWLNALLDLSLANPLLNLKDGRGAFRFELSAGQLANLEDRLMASDRGVELVPGTAAPNSVMDADDIHEATALELERTGRIFWPSPAQAEADIEGLKTKLREDDPEMPPAVVTRAAEQMVVEGFARELDKRVNAVKRKARELESQLGSNNLFVTIGAMSWTDPGTSGRRTKSERVTAPLYLIPVRITGSAKAGFRIVTDQSGEVIPNYCLLEKMRRTFDLDLAELEEPALDDAGIDVMRMLSSVRRSISEARVAGVTVEETAYLAVLSFAKFRLWKDLRDNWESFMGNSVVRHLVETPHQSYVDPRADAHLDGDDLLLPIEADESQREAIRWAVAGRSFVIEGPPGTGKSQTITNLLAAAIAANRKVLFVAEKQPALAVVKKRLERIGLEPFCIDLHDKGSKPEHIRQQLRQALDFTGVDRESEWQELTARHHADSTLLDTYQSAVHTENAAGYSVWSARQESIELGDGAVLPVPADVVHRPPHETIPVRDALLQLPQVASDASIASTAWPLADRPDFGSIDQHALEQLLATLAALRAEVQRSPGASEVLRLAASPSDVPAFVHAVRALQRLGRSTPGQIDDMATPEWTARVAEVVAKLRAFVADQSAALTVFVDATYRADLTQALATGEEFATSGMFGRGKRERAFRVSIAPFLRGPTEMDTADLFRLLQRVSIARSDQANLFAALRSLTGSELLSSLEPSSADQIDTIERELRRLADDAMVARGERATSLRQIMARGISLDGVDELLDRTATTWEAFLAMLGATEASSRRWCTGRHWSDAWATSEASWAADAPRFLGLQRWCELIGSLMPLRAVRLDDTAEAILRGEVPVEQAYDRYRRGLLSVAVDERRQAGRLDQFDGAAHDRRVRNFRDRDTSRRELMRTVIPHRLSLARPFKPGTRIGEYGALERELAKTKRSLSIRKLMERHGELLPNLTPCFLMSPDSVARFLPAGTAHFDLVVFDEASQIEVADAVGAMGRADAVVVVGDSRQMPPSKFGGSAATAGLDDDSDELVFEDLESILSECVESNMPRLWLQCHYRSRHESLITFSNHAFYEGRLITFPSPDPDGATALTWNRVDGVFHRKGAKEELRTNPIEAQAIVSEILRRLSDPAHAHQSICVVTLNIQQQSLITRLLEESGNERVRALLEDDGEDGLIVRNLESVQGDERDVVMLSIAFSPPVVDGVRGRLPLNFGPLNRQGGERRLNVAVTRAREEVVVFCSFEPEEMQLSTEPSKGLELLKQYLTIARGSASGSADLLMRAPQGRDLHRKEIADALRAAGLRVRENLGLSTFRVDLAVGSAEGDDWPIAVLLDGPAWAKRATVVDRDVLPAAVLSMMGWSHVIRIWLPTWIDERERVISQIEELLAGIAEPEEDDGFAAPAGAVSPTPFPAPVFAAPTVAATAPIASLAVPPSPHSPATIVPPPPAAVDVPAPSLPNEEREQIHTEPDDGDALPDFSPAPTDVVGDRDALDRLSERSARSQVQAQIDDVIRTEAPIQLERLARIVANRFGLARVRQSRLDELADLVPDELVVETPFGSFVWQSDEQYRAWVDFRPTPAGVDRKLTEIAPEELINAFVAIVADAGIIERAELVGITASVFGMSRVTAQARTHLDAVLDWSIEQGDLICSGQRIELPETDGG